MSMTAEEFLQMLRQSRAEIDRAVSRTLPVKVGRLAKDHFQENFRLGGFVDGGLRPWARTHRQRHADGAQAKYGPLMSGRQHLYGSIGYRPGVAQVDIGTDVSYADTHNEGGQIVVTRRMRSFFWAMYRKANGGTWKRRAEATGTAAFWRAMAMKKVGSVIRIPQRQFIGESRELTAKVQQTVEQEIMRILTST